MSDKQVIRVRFEQSPRYVEFHATGVWGGVNWFGELVMEIVEDLRLVPERLEVVLPEEGVGKPEEKPVFPEDVDIVRVRHARITMPMSVVPSIINWLQEKWDLYTKTTVSQIRTEGE